MRSNRGKKKAQVEGTGNNFVEGGTNDIAGHSWLDWAQLAGSGSVGWDRAQGAGSGTLSLEDRVPYLSQPQPAPASQRALLSQE